MVGRAQQSKLQRPDYSGSHLNTLSSTGGLGTLRYIDEHLALVRALVVAVVVVVVVVVVAVVVVVTVAVVASSVRSVPKLTTTPATNTRRRRVTVSLP